MERPEKDRDTLEAEAAAQDAVDDWETQRSAVRLVWANVRKKLNERPCRGRRWWGAAAVGPAENRDYFVQQSPRDGEERLWDVAVKAYADVEKSDVVFLLRLLADAIQNTPDKDLGDPYDELPF